MRVAVPPTNLLHPGREAAVGPRLLIRRETHAYLAANLYIYLYIHLSIYIYILTYIAPLQGNYSEVLPAQARPKRSQWWVSGYMSVEPDKLLEAQSFISN